MRALFLTFLLIACSEAEKTSVQTTQPNLEVEPTEVKLEIPEIVMEPKIIAEEPISPKKILPKQTVPKLVLSSEKPVSENPQEEDEKAHPIKPLVLPSSLGTTLSVLPQIAPEDCDTTVQEPDCIKDASK